jgi:hypothetical protein
MACGLALLASGQALALTVYISASPTIVDADLTDNTKWTAAPCGGPGGTAGTITMTNADIINICPGHSLNLTSATVAAGSLTFGSGAPAGTWGGTLLKFGAGNKTISNYNASLPTIALNISSMTAGNTFWIDGFGNPVTFSTVTGGTLSCTPAGGTASAYTPGTAIAPDTTCAVVAGGGAVSAPIDLNMNKPVESYSTEIKLN